MAIWSGQKSHSDKATFKVNLMTWFGTRKRVTQAEGTVSERLWAQTVWKSPERLGQVEPWDERCQPGEQETARVCSSSQPGLAILTVILDVMTGSLYGNFTGEVCVFMTKSVFLKNHSSCWIEIGYGGKRRHSGSRHWCGLGGRGCDLDETVVGETEKQMKISL